MRFADLLFAFRELDETKRYPHNIFVRLKSVIADNFSVDLGLNRLSEWEHSFIVIIHNFLYDICAVIIFHMLILRSWRHVQTDGDNHVPV